MINVTFANVFDIFFSKKKDFITCVEHVLGLWRCISFFKIEQMNVNLSKS